MAKNAATGLVEKALSSTERHGQSLKAVNEKLAELVSSLRDHKERLSVYSRSGAPPSGGNGGTPPGGDGDARMEPTALETSLAAELALAREALSERQEEQARLREQLAEIEAENRRLCDEFVAVQEQHADLVSLYATIERLHGAATRSAVLHAIQEIVINVVGSEEFALFEITPDGRRLTPSLAFGVEAGGWREIAVGSGTIGRIAAEGRPWFAGDGRAVDSGDSFPLTACVPLKVADDVTGVLAIFSLLAHKPSLTEFDRELFSVLERHAPLALRLRSPRSHRGLG